MSTFRTVLEFEVTRTLKKRAFWIGALAVPVLIIVIGLIQFLGSQSAQDAEAQLGDSRFAFLYVDESGLVDASVASGAGGTPIDSPDAGVEAVRSGSAEAFFHYPADPATEAIEVAGRHVNAFDDGRYGAVASAVLTESVRAEIGSDELVSIIQGGTRVDAVTYLPDGSVSNVLAAMPVGIVLLALLFLAVVLLGNPVLIATTEEKENRVAEILLTSARPNAVIAAKLVALGIVGLVQVGVILAPVLLGWLLFRDQLRLGELDLSSIVFDPQLVTLGVLILLAGIALYIASLAAVGAAAPSAKDAGGFTFIAIMLPLAPLYAAALIVSQPDSPIVQALTFFPFTAGTTALLRNAVGSLDLWEGVVVIAVLAVAAALMLALAARAFRRGALEYERMLGLRELLRRRR